MARGAKIAALIEAVCWQCHSGAIQSEEALGYDKTIGLDGWPVDLTALQKLSHRLRKCKS